MGVGFRGYKAVGIAWGRLTLSYGVVVKGSTHNDICRKGVCNAGPRGPVPQPLWLLFGPAHAHDTRDTYLGTSGGRWAGCRPSSLRALQAAFCPVGLQPLRGCTASLGVPRPSSPPSSTALSSPQQNCDGHQLMANVDGCQPTVLDCGRMAECHLRVSGVGGLLRGLGLLQV